MMKKFKKIFFIYIIIFNIIFLFSCRKLDNKYEFNDFLNSLSETDFNTSANGVAKNIIIPDLLEQNVVNSITADAYLIMSTNRFSSSAVKYHNPYKKLPMASLTKLMTALVVLKNCKDFDEQYFVSSEAVDLEKNASVAKLQEGDRVSVLDLLYGLLVPSGNDSAYCLAENLFDNYDNFIVEMNNEAERLGALNTHFANPHGLDAEYHFTTCFDLFLITRELMKYDLFKQITTCKEWTYNILQSDGSYRTETILNTNYFATGELLLQSGFSVIAGKTGSTSNAGYCLVLVSKNSKTGNEFISVVLNASSKRNSFYNTNTLIGALFN